MMRLLELPEPVQQLLRTDRITSGHARALLPLAAEQQCVLATRIETEQLSVRLAEEIVREMLQSAPATQIDESGENAADSAVAKPEMSNHVLSLQGALRDVLGAKIDIRLKKNDAGQIVIHFNGNADFERIVGKLRKSA